jgi:nucleotide sugar dehydrogenase
MNIGIIGGGMVGNALANGFKQNNLLISDPSINDITIVDVCRSVDIVFVCVPTPTNNDVFDSSIIDGVMSEINENYQGDVVIKSTIPPNFLMDIYNNSNNINLAYNPEFLTDRTANDDFVNPYMVVIGSEDDGLSSRIEEIYRTQSIVRCDVYHKVDLVSASLIKYGFNTFFATKVIFMNELYGVFQQSGTSMAWEEFRVLIGSNPWVGGSHNSVPGHDGYFGYGGKCFPKDTGAFSKYADSLGKPSHLLNKAIELNSNYRKKA